MLLEELIAKIEADAQWGKDHIVRGTILNIYDRLVYRYPYKVREFFTECRYAYQRVHRGFDSRYVWGHCHANADMVLRALKLLKEEKRGYPLIEENGADTTMLQPHVLDDAHTSEYEKKWNSILDEMIAGFQAFIDLDDVYITGPDGKYDVEESRKKYDELFKVWEKGAAQYIKHYNNLWD